MHRRIQATCAKSAKSCIRKYIPVADIDTCCLSAARLPFQKQYKKIFIRVANYATLKLFDMKRYFSQFFKDKAYIKLILVLAMPIAFGNLLSALLHVADGIMVSFLEDSVPKMAAVLLCNQIIFIFSVIIFAIGSTAGVFTAQFYGKKDLNEVSKCVGISLIFAISLGVLFNLVCFLFAQNILGLFSSDDLVIRYGEEFLKISAFSFVPFAASTVIGLALRGMRKNVPSLIVIFLGVCFNVFFNYVLMFGALGFPNLGLKGVAWGTVIARTMELVLIVLICILKKYPVIGSPKKMLSFNKQLFKRNVAYMFPAMANEVFWVIGTTCYLAFVGKMANSTVLQAAISITSYIDKLIYVFLIGIGTASSVIIGNQLGAKKFEEAQKSGEKSIVFSVIVGLCCSLIMFLTIPLIPFLYSNESGEVIKIASNLIIVFGAFMVIRALNFTFFIGILRGGGDAKFALIIESITIWGVAVPFCYLAAVVFGLSIELVYTFIFFEEVVKLVIVFFRFKSGRWRKNLVEDC